MPWIANTAFGTLDLGTVFAIGESKPAQGHRMVLKVGDELWIDQHRGDPKIRTEVIQKSSEEMVISLADGTRFRLTLTESNEPKSNFQGELPTEDWTLREKW